MYVFIGGPGRDGYWVSLSRGVTNHWWLGNAGLVQRLSKFFSHFSLANANSVNSSPTKTTNGNCKNFASVTAVIISVTAVKAVYTCKLLWLLPDTDRRMLRFIMELELHHGTNHRLQKVCICWWPSNRACWWRLANNGRGAEQRHGNRRWLQPDLEVKAQHYKTSVGSLSP